MMTRLRCWFGLLIALASLGLAVQVNAQEQREIMVSGTAEIKIKPDYIEWRLKLSDRDMDPVKAKDANDERYEAMVKLAKKMDIDSSDVVIGQVSIERDFERNANGEYVFKGYRVERRITLVQRELKEFNEMLGSLAKAKVEFGIRYGSDKLEETKRKAQLAAVKAAKQKADALAGVLGQKVGRPIYITDHDTKSNYEFRDPLSNSSSGSAGGGAIKDARYGLITVRAGVDIQFVLLDQ